jgi:SAM-dependent methyltransferase
VALQSGLDDAMKNGTANYLLDHFGQPGIWDGDFASNPYWAQKTRLIRAFIPASIRTILDVGCGNGALTRHLAQEYQVYGVDGSFVPLKQTKVPKSQGFADYLPFASHSVDLVLSSEMLEHLPDAVLQQAVTELARVTRDWLLITVPFNESLALRYMWCDVCQRPFNIYGHIQSFSLRDLQALFTGWNLHSWAHCGTFDQAYPGWLLWIRQRLGNGWYFDENISMMCPYCGKSHFEQPRINRVVYWCTQVYENVYENKRRQQPYWIVTLWQRQRVGDSVYVA